MSSAPSVAAFFDLDRTLLTVNSGRLWLARERREKRVSAWQLVQGSFFILAYSLHAVDMQGVMIRALRTVQGLDEDTLRAWTREWFDTEVKQHEAPGARAALAWHRAQGHPCVLLTASSPYESELAAAHFGLDGWLSTRYQVVDGKLTGQVVQPLCYGPGKVTYAERYATEHGLDVDGSYFYTDSITDLPMLERVQNRRVVQPDLRLRRLARRRGWPVLDWSRADSALRSVA